MRRSTCDCHQANPDSSLVIILTVAFSGGVDRHSVPLSKQSREFGRGFKAKSRVHACGGGGWK